MTTPIIKKADAASDIIVDNWRKALSALEYGGGTNGYGILYDPRADYNRLLDAKEAIDAAVATYRATHWPTDEEYDEAEAAAYRPETVEEWP